MVYLRKCIINSQILKLNQNLGKNIKSHFYYSQDNNQNKLLKDYFKNKKLHRTRNQTPAESFRETLEKHKPSSSETFKKNSIVKQTNNNDLNVNQKQNDFSYLANKESPEIKLEKMLKKLEDASKKNLQPKQFTFEDEIKSRRDQASRTIVFRLNSKRGSQSQATQLIYHIRRLPGCNIKNAFLIGKNFIII